MSHHYSGPRLRFPARGRAPGALRICMPFPSLELRQVDPDHERAPVRRRGAAGTLPRPRFFDPGIV